MKNAVFILTFSMLAASFAVATPFSTNLFNTGVNASGVALGPDGVVDPNFTSSSGTAETYYYSAWTPDPTGANWITTYIAGSPTEGVGLYNYTETLTANATGVVTISGNWATDNCGAINWNGGAVAGTGTTIGGGVSSSSCTSPTSAFTTPTAFSFTESVTSGSTYTLDFQVYNAGFVTGLLVTDLAAACASPGAGGCSTTSATPEPSAILLTLTGLVMLGMAIAWRRT